MDSATLADVMGHVIPQSTYDRYVGPFNNAMIAAGCTTVNRAAMWCAQLGHESVGLKYMEEIASGAAYEGRRDLGNTQPGDGRRFKGRGPIQLTGRANYGSFGRWAHAHGYVDSDDYFVRNPLKVADPNWGLLAASWYWTVARNMNSYADAGSILGATKAVNGGTNGLADRTARWNRARTFGSRLLPTGTQEEPDMTDAERQMLQDVHDALPAITETHELLKWMWSQLAGENAAPFQFTGWPSFVAGSTERLTLVDYNRSNNELLHALLTALTEAQAGTQA